MVRVARRYHNFLLVLGIIISFLLRPYYSAIVSGCVIQNRGCFQKHKQAGDSAVIVG